MCFVAPPRPTVNLSCEIMLSQIEIAEQDGWDGDDEGDGTSACKDETLTHMLGQPSSCTPATSSRSTNLSAMLEQSM